MLVEVPEREPRIMPVNVTGSPSDSETVFDVSVFSQPSTSVSSAIWIERAGPESYVCDGTGKIIIWVKENES